jgi:ribosomal protein S19
MIYIQEFGSNSKLARYIQPLLAHKYGVNSSRLGTPKSFISLVDLRSRQSASGALVHPKRSAAKPADWYSFTRSLVVGLSLSGARVGIYQGSRFHVFRIRREIVGARFTDFVPTRKLSPNIGSKKSHGYSRPSRKKPGVTAVKRKL